MKSYLIMAGIAVVVSLIVVAFFARPVQTVVNQATNGNLGAVASPDIQSPYFSYGGVRHWAVRSDSLNSASTTICSMQSPVATSSLIGASVRLSTTGTTTSTTIVLAKSSLMSASTTKLASGTAGSLAQAVVVASSTGAGTDISNAGVFAPNQWINVTMNGGGGGFSPTGTCEAAWMSVE